MSEYILSFDSSETLQATAALFVKEEVGDCSPPEITSCGSLGLGGVRYRLLGEVATQQSSAESLLACINEALSMAKVSLAEVGVLLVGVGPGSYTGIRNALALAAGLAYGRAAEFKIHGVSTFLGKLFYCLDNSDNFLEQIFSFCEQRRAVSSTLTQPAKFFIYETANRQEVVGVEIGYSAEKKEISLCSGLLVFDRQNIPLQDLNLKGINLDEFFTGPINLAKNFISIFRYQVACLTPESNLLLQGAESQSYVTGSVLNRVNQFNLLFNLLPLYVKPVQAKTKLERLTGLR